jgi:uncharacterized protein (TIGR02147 family)
MRPIFEYTDFRRYLADYYEEQKATKPWFSYRYLSSMIGFRARGFIYRVIKGQKSLSQASIAKVSQALRHTPEESRYFEALVRFNQAKTADEKAFYLQRLRKAPKKARKETIIQKITGQELALFAEWRHVATRAILEMAPFRDDYAWLARQCTPPITAHQAKQSVKHLEKLGMVERDEDGYRHITSNIVTTDNEVESLYLVRFYLSCLRLASDALKNLPRDKRNVAGVTMGISRKNYPKVVAAIQRFRNELEQLAGADDEPDIVYQFQSVLFPLSSPIEPPHGGTHDRP